MQDPLEEYLEPEEVARIIRCHKYTLAIMRMKGRGPTYLKIGHRTVLYRRSDVDAWMAKHQRTTTQGPIDLEGLDL